MPSVDRAAAAAAGTAGGCTRVHLLRVLVRLDVKVDRNGGGSLLLTSSSGSSTVLQKGRRLTPEEVSAVLLRLEVSAEQFDEMR